MIKQACIVLMLFVNMCFALDTYIAAYVDNYR